MADLTEINCEDLESHPGAPMNAAEVKAWFIREVLPLEADLMQFLHHNWRNKSDIADLRQDVYARVFESAHREIPTNTRIFVLTTAKNVLINRVRRERIVAFDAVADVDAFGLAADTPGPERIAIARDELRRLHSALDRLPARPREAVILGRIEGMTGRQIAARLRISEAAVSKLIDGGIRTLANILYGDPSNRNGA